MAETLVAPETSAQAPRLQPHVLPLLPLQHTEYRLARSTREAAQTHVETTREAFRAQALGLAFNTRHAYLGQMLADGTLVEIPNVKDQTSGRRRYVTPGGQWIPHPSYGYYKIEITMPPDNEAGAPAIKVQYGVATDNTTINLHVQQTNGEPPIAIVTGNRGGLEPMPFSLDDTAAATVRPSVQAAGAAVARATNLFSELTGLGPNPTGSQIASVQTAVPAAH